MQSYKEAIEKGEVVERNFSHSNLLELLHHSIKFNNRACFDYLFDQRPKLRVEWKPYTSLLNTCCIVGNVEIAKILLDYGPDVGVDHIRFAIKSMTAELIQLLLPHYTGPWNSILRDLKKEVEALRTAIIIPRIDIVAIIS